MNKVTAWSTYNHKKERWEHNHLDDGWVMGLQPVPKFPSQKSWAGKRWKKQYCHIDSNQVVTPAGV